MAPYFHCLSILINLICVLHACTNWCVSVLIHRGEGHPPTSAKILTSVVKFVPDTRSLPYYAGILFNAKNYAGIIGSGLIIGIHVFSLQLSLCCCAFFNND